MGCPAECYVGGKGCAISDDGRCAILYENKQKDYVKNFKQVVKQYLEDWDKATKRNVKSSK